MAAGSVAVRDGEATGAQQHRHAQDALRPARTLSAAPPGEATTSSAVQHAVATDGLEELRSSLPPLNA